MSSNDIQFLAVDLSDPPLGLDGRYRPALEQIFRWGAASDDYRPTSDAVGNDWHWQDVAHFSAVWAANKMLNECRHWISREVDPATASEMWEDLHSKSQA